MSAEQNNICKITSEELILYIYGEHSSEVAFRKHIDSCERCSNELNGLSVALKTARASLPELTPSHSVKNTILTATRLHKAVSGPSWLEKVETWFTDAFRTPITKPVMAGVLVAGVALTVVITSLYNTKPPAPVNITENDSVYELSDELDNLSDELDVLSNEFEGQGVLVGFVVTRQKQLSAGQPADLEYMLEEIKDMDNTLEDMESVLKTY